jgi:hypothetical protein
MLTKYLSLLRRTFIGVAIAGCASVWAEAAAAVRAGKGSREEFTKIKAETDKYYSSLSGSLAVRVSRDIQSCLSLTPDRNR